MANFIKEKTALDDWQHASGSVDGDVAINIAFATSQSSLHS